MIHIFFSFISGICFLVCFTADQWDTIPVLQKAQGMVERAKPLYLLGDKPTMSPSWVGFRCRGDKDMLFGVPSVPDKAQHHVGSLACAQWPWWMISLTDCYISPLEALGALMSWSVKVEIPSVSWLDGWVEDGLWEVSSPLIVKVLWKSEPEVMAEEVSGVRSLDAGCPSPSYLSPGSWTRSCDVLGCAHAWGCGWVLPGFPNPDAHSGVKFSVCSAVNKACVLSSLPPPPLVMSYVQGMSPLWVNSVIPLPQHITNKTRCYCLETEACLKCHKVATQPIGRRLGS